MLRLFRKKAKGFTLIELLIVVAIIGILAAIAIPNLLSAQRKAKMSKALADTKQMVTQAQLYNNDYNNYPPDVTTLFTLGYISRTYDPFSAAPTSQNYGFSAASAHTWALSVGPNSATSGTVATWPAGLATGISGSNCLGVVGWSNAYGNVQPSGC